MQHKQVRQQKQVDSESRHHYRTFEGLLNVEQFADALGWSAATVRMKVWKREVEFVRMGRSIRFRPKPCTGLSKKIQFQCSLNSCMVLTQPEMPVGSDEMVALRNARL
jgi:hypothetical protein